MTKKTTNLIQDTLIDELTSEKTIDLDIIKILLDKNAKFTEKSIEKACNRDKIDLLNLLIDSNNIFNISEATVNHIIIYRKKEFLNLLINNCKINKHHFYLACQYGNLDIIKLVADSIGSTDLLTNDEFIELISSGITRSSKCCNKEVLEFLLQYI